jgi:hypothetical protein
MSGSVFYTRLAKTECDSYVFIPHVDWPVMSNIIRCKGCYLLWYLPGRSVDYVTILCTVYLSCYAVNVCLENGCGRWAGNDWAGRDVNLFQNELTE